MSEKDETAAAEATQLNFRTEGFVVAGASVLGYLAAYRYEVGIADYWDIPRSLIEISLSTVVASAFATFFSLAF